MTSHDSAMHLRRIDVPTLVRMRVERHWSQNALATRSGVGPRTIGRIEAGDHDVHLITATKLAVALNVPLDDISTAVGDSGKRAS